MSTRDHDHAHQQRHTSRSETQDKLPARVLREDDKDKHRRRSEPTRDRHASPHGNGHKRESLSQHRLSESRRGAEPHAKAAAEHRPSQGSRGEALNQQAQQGRKPSETIQPDHSRRQSDTHHADVRQRDRSTPRDGHHADVQKRDWSTPRDRFQGRFVVPHSQQVSVSMRDGNAQAAYPQAWPSRDQQRPHRPNPFRGGGKWKHDLFEELTKPPATAEQGGASKTAASADLTPQC
ncbi:hypothetical protein ABBQ32_006819 [Trebouxia sp. C0010 RCD-2024]